MEILIIVVFAGLIVAGAYFSYLQNKRRAEALEALAARRGWTLSTDYAYDFDERYPSFACLRQGSSRYAYNVLSGPSGSDGFTGFDYHYETYSTDSKGNRRTDHHYFSAVVIETRLPLKPLLIRPETVLDKFGEFFGFDDIDFESHEFSKRFYVKADDKRWAFDVIHQATMEHLLQAPRFAIEFAGSRVMATRSATFEPAEFEAAEQAIRGILDRLPKYLHQEWKGAQS